MYINDLDPDLIRMLSKSFDTWYVSSIHTWHDLKVFKKMQIKCCHYETKTNPYLKHYFLSNVFTVNDALLPRLILKV